jgi:hypothetical protein
MSKKLSITDEMQRNLEPLDMLGLTLISRSEMATLLRLIAANRFSNTA